MPTMVKIDGINRKRKTRRQNERQLIMEALLHSSFGA